MWKIINFYIFIKSFYGECKMQLNINGFNTFKINDSIHVQMLIIQKMWGLYKLLDVFYWIMISVIVP
jgi:hypothetical protein